MTSSNEVLDKLAITTDSLSFFEWTNRLLQKKSPWIVPFGLSCCSLEVDSSFIDKELIRYDALSLKRINPAEADMLIFAGSMNAKLLPIVKEIHAQLKGPKWVMAVGACAASGGLYSEGYNAIHGLGSYFPVDVYVPGCPPTPSEIQNGFMLMRERIDKNISRWQSWQGALT